MKINLLNMMNSMNNYNNKGTQNFLPGIKFGGGKGTHPIPRKWIRPVEEEQESLFEEDTHEEYSQENPAAPPEPVKISREQAVLPVKKEKPAEASREEKLQKAVVWAEILGEPVSKRRKRKRWEQRYGNQGNAGRR